MCAERAKASKPTTLSRSATAGRTRAMACRSARVATLASVRPSGGRGDSELGSIARGMRLPVMVLSVLVLGLVAGCGDDDADEAGGGANTAEERTAHAETKPEPTGAAKFTGQDRRNYEEAKAICSSSPPSKVASDLGLDVDVHTSEGLGRIAEKYAEDYRPNFRQAVFEGCLDGLPKP